MRELTVAELREVLNTTLERLEDCDDDAEIRVVGNTYFLSGARYYMSIAGVGFINLSHIDLEDEDGDE